MRFYAIALPFTSNQMKQWLDEANFFRVRHSIDKAIKVARFIGCDVIALGQYTSIVTRNATTLQLPHVGLTTGNSYTIALALEAIERALSERGLDHGGGDARRGRCVGEHRTDLRRDSGAAVRRDRACSEAASRPHCVVWPICRPVSHGRASMPTRRRCGRRMSCSRPRMPRRRFSRPTSLADGAIVCDLSVPAAVRPDVREARPDLLLIGGGIARLPFGEAHGIVGFPLPPGQVYGCMAETMLLGLEGVRDATFTGFLPAEHVYRLAAMAKRHGFTLAEYKTHATMGPPNGALRV